MLFDTHAHINVDGFDADRDEVIERAKEVGVSRIVNVGFNREMIEQTLHLVEQEPIIYAAIGWHPHDANQMTDADLKWIEEKSNHPKVVAIGEMGLDYHYDHSPADVQKEVFRLQIELAKRVQKPIIIHDRDAHEDVLHILQENNAEEVGGIMHCFGGDVHMAEACMDMDFYISFGGPLTFKNATLPKEVAQHVPLERLLIETDSPFLSPHPYRGKRNEPARVRLVAEKMAEIKNVSYDALCRVTYENATRVFGL